MEKETVKNSDNAHGGSLDIPANGDVKETVKYSDNGKTLVSYRGDASTFIIPDGVTEIGDRAFWDCDTLCSVTIPDSVTRIGHCAFSSCCALTSVRIPKGVREIGAAVFLGCDALTSVIVQPGNPFYDSRGGCNGIIRTADNTLVATCPATVIAEGVTTIGEFAFISSHATSIRIPDSVRCIEESAFDGCIHLATLILPERVTSIGEAAFTECRALTSIDIPGSVTDIGNEAFWATGLQEMRVHWAEPDRVTVGNLFKGTADAITLRVPAGTAEAYRRHPYFSRCGAIVEE